jgi:M6 family metalloprotease-like protein
MRRPLITVWCLIAVALSGAPSASEAVDPGKTLEITIGSYSFDPLRKEPIIPESLRARDVTGGGRKIVQFQHALTQEERAETQRLGLKLTRYVPQFSYIEDLPKPAVETLRRLPYVRWIGPFHPAYKIDAQIGKHQFVSPTRKAVKGVLLIVRLAPEASVQAVVDAIQKLNVEVVRILPPSKSSRNQGARLRVRGNDVSLLPKLAAIPEVEWIEEEGDVTLDNTTEAALVQSDGTTQNPLYNQGLHGEGQIIGIIDDQIDLANCYFNDPAHATPGPAHRKVVGYHQAGSATTFAGPNTCVSPNRGHGTHTCGTVAGFNTAAGSTDNGIASAARLAWGDLNDVTFSTGAGTVALLNYLDDDHGDGATIHSNSFSDKATTAYTSMSQDVDTFTWANEDDLVVVSTSNNTGPAGLMVPASPHPPWTSKIALAVAATQASPNQNSVSSGGQGPTFDNRRKPDIYAPGTGVLSAEAGTTCATSGCTGSSMATPAIAASGALVRQYFTEGFYPSGTRQPANGFTPSGALLKAMLLNSTRAMNGTDANGSAAPLVGYPSNLGGWGRLVLSDALFFAGTSTRNLRVWDFHNDTGLATGGTRNHFFRVVDNTQPLKITLVWTDPPPTTSAFGAPVVNDLDLTVTDPNGLVYRGNNFNAGASVTGGVSDTVNNAEMVLVNAPPAGLWTITVSGTTVNVGNPNQGYALVTTARMPVPPPVVGAQDTLVVQVRYPDISTAPSLANIMTTINDVASYVAEASYGKTTLVPTYVGPYTLPNNHDYYSSSGHHPIIDVATDAIAAVIAASATALDGIDRLVIVTNESGTENDWATTGPWPYDLPAGLPRPLSVSIQGYDNGVEQFAHSLGHHFNLVDLYAHPGVTFARPTYAGGWDIMAKPLATQLQPLVWSKERATWVTSSGSTIEYLPRPPAASTVTNTYQLFAQESASANRKAVAIGLTLGAGTLPAEHTFYFAEARKRSIGTQDVHAPSDGVLVYFVNDRIPSGQGPVIVQNKNVAVTDLSQAAFTIGDSVTVPGTGLTIDVLAPSGTNDYDIRITYQSPSDNFDVSITAGDTINGTFSNVLSADVWVDSPVNGYALSGGPPPRANREQPVANVLNKLYGRVHNSGPATAFNFDVRFRVSAPYHTVGGEADFNTFVGIAHVDSLASGASQILEVDWTPGVSGHTCAFVDLINIVGNDTDPNDNSAQENMDVKASLTGSPFHPVTFRYSMTNPYHDPALFLFRADDVPTGWTAVFNPRRILLAPGQRVEASLTLTPNPDEKVCTSKVVQVSSWTPRGDTLIRVGGAVVQVDLRNRTTITIDSKVVPCDGREKPPATEEVVPPNLRKAQRTRPCGRVVAQGCTDPPQPNQHITLQYTGPDGKPVFHEVVTDANGCYEDYLATVTGGDWTVVATFPGGDCDGPATSSVSPTCWCPNGAATDYRRLVILLILILIALIALLVLVARLASRPARSKYVARTL